MSPAVRTFLFVIAAIAAVATANWIEPSGYRQEIFSDQGQAFFPTFRDILAVKAIEVVDYDESDATARPLKVEFRKNRWLITSNNDYPAEAKDRLAKTAAALIDLKRDLVVSDRLEDQARFGVIDPLDAKNPSLTGRGKRVTLRDGQGAVLADLIFGKPVEGRAGYRYARTPGGKRTYAVKTDADASADFADWVEPDLLRVRTNDIARMVLNSYQIDEQVGRIVNQQRTEMIPDQQNWDAKAKMIASTLGTLRVAGARPKPPELAEQLKTRRLALTLDVVMSLRQRGFYLTQDGRLLADDGELLVETKSDLSYTIRFGQIVTDTTNGKQKENRFLFVTVGAKTPEAENRARALDARFADWYYIISGADFARLHPTPSAATLRPPPAAPKPQ